MCITLFVTRLEKTNLIYTKYTYSYDNNLLFCMCFTKSVSFIEFLMEFYKECCI